MTTFNTGNPVPSAQAKDRYDNSQTFDEVMNGTFTYYVNRVGANVYSLAGMATLFNAAQLARANEYAADKEYRDDTYTADKLARDTEFAEDQVERAGEFDVAQDAREAEFNAWINLSGFENPPLAYVDGSPLVVDRVTQLVERLGILYTVRRPASFPYTLTGTWAVDSTHLVVRADQALRQDLADHTDPSLGAAIVGRAVRVVHTIEELRTVTASYAGETFSLVSYSDGWAATLIGPQGGGLFFYDDSDVVSVDNGGSIIVNGDDQRLRRYNATRATSVEWGAPTDGISDSFPRLSAALAWLQSVGSGTLELTPIGVPYMINNSLQIGNNIHLICNEWLKWMSGTGATDFDGALVGIPGATDWRVSGGLKVDCNSRPSKGALYLRRNNTGCHIDSVECLNAVHSKTTKGGRAVTIEAGSNPVLYKTRRSTIGNIIAKDCYNAVTVQGGVDAESSNWIIWNVTAENCETVINLFGNTSGYPHAGDKMQGLIMHVTARNCGKSTTYARSHGLINSDRGSNIVIGTISVVNDPGYGTIGAMVLGDFYNCRIGPFYFEGDCTRLGTFGRFAEEDTITDDIFTSSRNFFDLSHSGTCADTVTASKSDGLKVTDSEIVVRSDTVTSGNTMTSAMATMASVFMRVWARPSNARVRGFCSQMGVKTLSTYAGLDQSFSDFLVGGLTYAPPSLAVGASDPIERTATITGAAVGDFVEAGFSLDTMGMQIVARVSSANTVKFYMHNPAGNPNGTQALVSGTARFRIRKR